MHYLNWNDWQEFIATIRKKVADSDFRLPTEAEWEYACRAGSRTEYCYGDAPAQLDEYASFCADDAPRWSERDIPDFRVGQRKPNIWGMHGNVREWCSH
jgi:formylglycine-generating enzyme required for sulfatase activity